MRRKFPSVIVFQGIMSPILHVFSDTITAAQYEQLNNAAISENAILNTFINAQFTNRMGAELTLTTSSVN